MTLTKQEKETLKNLMSCGMLEKEALQVISDDREIDKGKKLFELSDEQKINAKKARAVGRKPNSKPTVRERKADSDKRKLIEILRTALVADDISDVEISNIEREINFKFNNRKFKIVLSAPRS